MSIIWLSLGSSASKMLILFAVRVITNLLLQEKYQNAVFAFLSVFLSSIDYKYSLVQ